MATKKGYKCQGVGRVFFIEKDAHGRFADDWTHATLLHCCTAGRTSLPS